MPNDGAVIGPLYIRGADDAAGCDLKLNNNVDIIVRTPIWVNGNILTGINTSIILDPSYGSLSGVIIADYPASMSTRGTIKLGNSTYVCGSGGFNGAQCDNTNGSFMLLVSTYSGVGNAIDLGVATDGNALYAPDGTVRFNNSISANAVVANKLDIGVSVNFTYLDGLASMVFGPPGQGGGGAQWNISSWREFAP